MVRVEKDHGDWFSARLTVEEVDSQTRIDVLLTEALKVLSRQDESAPEWFLNFQPTRSLVQSMIESGQVSANNERVAKNSRKFPAGTEVVFSVVAEPVVSLEADASVVFEVVAEDDDILVVNKPAGLVVHPGAGVKDGTLVNGVLAHLRMGERPGHAERPGLVHRLDKDTSGLLVVAKTQRAFVNLVEQFKTRSIKRTYYAVVRTRPQGEGRIDLPIARDRRLRTRMAVDPDGKQAITNWQVERVLSRGLLLRVTLETGRTHQIRVHLEAAGAPIVGDPVYQGTKQHDDAQGSLMSVFPRQALHAKELAFRHPTRDERVQYQCNIPADMKALLEEME